MTRKEVVTILMYLGGAVLANLMIVWFGPKVAVITAFLLIGLDLSSRDVLHDMWKGKGLFLRLGMLIATGSVLSAVINISAAPIAIASFVAFVCAGTADTLIYILLGNKAKLVKMNGSNLVSAAVDSVVFPALAFGFPLLWTIMIGQFVAKVVGGLVWSLILRKVVQ